jgi:undecaprenyl-diphosphatase
VELVKALLLGIIQGATEFLPVSSSGHLVLGSHLLGFEQQSVFFDVMLHLGTLASVLVVFRKELLAMFFAPFKWLAGVRGEATRDALLWDIYVVIGTIPAVIVGFLLKDRIEMLFTSVLTVCLALIVTGVMMLLSRYISDRGEQVSGVRAFFIGCGQACAIVPGLSRSGTTIFVGMLLGINRETVARFSFIMSIPAIMGAAVLNAGEILAHPPALDSMINLLAGTLAAAVTGYLAIILLLDIIRKNRLPWFGYYCLAIAFTGLVVLALVD